MLRLTGMIGAMVAGIMSLGGSGTDAASSEMDDESEDMTRQADREDMLASLDLDTDFFPDIDHTDTALDSDSETAAPDGDAVVPGGILVGSDWDDVIAGSADDDQIGGNGGHDWISGSSGDDDIFGADGNDTLHGDAGEDTLHGDAGDDSLHGGAQNDSLFGHGGGDLLIGGDGNDSLVGGADDDRVFGDMDEDALLGGLGHDTLSGGTGADTVFGGDGNDILTGGGPDLEASNDADLDYLNGGQGDDTLLAGQDDILSGGQGQDAFVLGDWITPGSPATITDYEPLEDQLLLIWDDTQPDAREPHIDIASDEDNPDVRLILMNGVSVAQVCGDLHLAVRDVGLVPFSAAQGANWAI